MTRPVVRTAGEIRLFACAVRRLLTPSALGLGDHPAIREAHAVGMGHRRVDLVRILLLASGAAECTIDLRLIAHPNPAQPSTGSLSMAILVREEGAPDGASPAHATATLRLLEANFPEAEWELLNGDELLAVARPFAPHAVVRVARRLDVLHPDALAAVAQRVVLPGTESRGDTNPRPGASGTDDRGLLNVASFVPRVDALPQLARLMLLQPEATALSIRLKATSLSPAESELLQGQLLATDFVDPALGRVFNDMSTLHGRRLLGLRAGAIVGQVELAGAGPLAPTLVAAVGTALTEPVGGMAGDLRSPLEGRYLAGGYDTAPAADIAAAAALFCTAGLGASLVQPDPADPSRRLRHLFDVQEAGALVVLPPLPLDRFPGVAARGWRIVPPPRGLPEEGAQLGIAEEFGVEQAVRVAWPDRLRHEYVVGQTGTGKTTLLTGQIVEDMNAGAGLVVLDPSGDMTEDLLTRVPASRAGDVILIDPTDVEHPVGLNPLECRSEAERQFVAQSIVDIILRLLVDEHGREGAAWAGPIFQQHVKMNLLLVMSHPKRVGSLFDFYQIFQDKDYWKTLVHDGISDPLLQSWVSSTLPSTNYLQTSSDGLHLGSYMSSKFERFLFNPFLRNILAQRHSTVDFRAAFSLRKIVLVNLAKGELTEGNSRFLGMVLLGMLLSAALERIQLPPERRVPFYLYVDEFQNVATESFVTMLSEGRKFGLGVTLANQFLSQIPERIRDAVFGNVGTLASFRVGPADAELLERRMLPSFSRTDLVNLPNWQACVSMTNRDRVLDPFSIRTRQLPPPTGEGGTAHIIAESRRQYAPWSRDKVEAEILNAWNEYRNAG